MADETKTPQPSVANTVVASVANPVLPPDPWYASPAQRAGFAALLTSIVSMVLQLFGKNIDIQIINLKVGLVLQIISACYTVWAMVKRARSNIQPLTWTRKGAENRAETAQLDPATLAPKTTGAG